MDFKPQGYEEHPGNLHSSGLSLLIHDIITLSDGMS